jgi:hypothetical protein
MRYLISAVAALAGGALGFLAGSSSKMLVRHLVDRYGGKMMHLARHYQNNLANGRGKLRYVPSSVRARLDYVVGSINGVIGMAISGLAGNSADELGSPA